MNTAFEALLVRAAAPQRSAAVQPLASPPHAEAELENHREKAQGDLNPHVMRCQRSCLSTIMFVVPLRASTLLITAAHPPAGPPARPPAARLLHAGFPRAGELAGGAPEGGPAANAAAEAEAAAGAKDHEGARCGGDGGSSSGVRTRRPGIGSAGDSSER